ncbi:cell division protein SepF [Adlercreutzia sp. ZJ304]|uniref:cell division protein SepF n=1 Tax=Adlercreutzia sp. ZJ304 TaxID=2709791 RepID=UPI0013EA5771|nr:cell division protein SepF [Adlercreutzia sp. ZJ304]
MANMGDMFGGIKEKLGFGSRQTDADYDEYDEYDEYEDDYEDDYDDYDDGAYTPPHGGYGNRNTVTTREVGASVPRLVSYSDVRDSSRARNYSRSRTTGSVVGRTMMDSSLPRSMTPEGAAEVSAAASRRHANGLDSLFSSTSQKSDSGASSRLGVIGAASANAALSSSTASNAANRGLRILKPTEYSQVSEVASMLRAGDAVVLVFKSTPESLEKRLLDFSFGVASALGANVECIGSKVFSITVGPGLSESEQTSLHTQGIL